MKVAYASSYNKKRKHYRQVQKTREQENLRRFNEWKAIQKCTNCPEDDPCCLDLHHRNPEKKDFNISDRAKSVSWKTLHFEIQKCIVVCRNCHAKIHAGRDINN